jgi:hypothetical protein
MMINEFKFTLGSQIIKVDHLSPNTPLVKTGDSGMFLKLKQFKDFIRFLKLHH